MNKYHNTRVGKYASKKEAKRAAELRLMENAGLIHDLKEQVKWQLIPPQKLANGKTERGCAYIADFDYRSAGGDLVVEDVKGIKTDVFIIKRKLMLLFHGIEILET